MNHFERAFLFMVIALHVTMFLRVVYTSAVWRAEFVLAFAACVLIFLQFLTRYVAITHLYKTETTVVAWFISFMVVIFSLVSVENTTRFPAWFLSFGILLILATIKTKQSKQAIIASKTLSMERIARLGEFMIVESGFGFLMVLLFILSATGIESRFDFSSQNLALFGSFLGLFYSVLSTTISVVRVWRNKRAIESYLKE